MERILALYDSDVFYATRFLEYFKMKKEYGFVISVFTKMESLKEFLLNHHIEILLIGERLAAEDFPEGKIKYIYLLTEDPAQELNGYPCVCKYQPAQSMMDELLSDYRKKDNELRMPVGSGKVELISIFSPLPSSETISFAWSLGALLSEQKKVLLVMLEQFPVPIVSFVDGAERSLTELLYYLKEQKNILPRMNTLLRFHKKLAYLAGVSHGSDLLALSKEDMKGWIEELKGHTDYQVIVFFIGCYTDAITLLIDSSDSVLIVGKGSFYEEAVNREWAMQMEKSGVSTQQAKFSTLRIPEDRKLGAAPLTLEELSQKGPWIIAKQFLAVQAEPTGMN